jgi:hypothetical protein
MAVLYLEMDDVCSMLRTSKNWRKRLKVHENIIRKTRNNSIYKDKLLLQTVYQYHPNYFIEWEIVGDQFISESGILYPNEEGNTSDTTILFNDKIVQFNDWKGLFSVLRNSFIQFHFVEF